MSSKSSPNDKAASRAAKAAELRREQERAEKRRRMLMIGGVGLLSVGHQPSMDGPGPGGPAARRQPADLPYFTGRDEAQQRTPGQRSRHDPGLHAGVRRRRHSRHREDRPGHSSRVSADRRLSGRATLRRPAGLRSRAVRAASRRGAPGFPNTLGVPDTDIPASHHVAPSGGGAIAGATDIPAAVGGRRSGQGYADRVQVEVVAVGAGEQEQRFVADGQAVADGLGHRVGLGPDRRVAQPPTPEACSANATRQGIPIRFFGAGAFCARGRAGRSPPGCGRPASGAPPEALL